MKKTITKITMLALIGLSHVTNGQTPNCIWAESPTGLSPNLDISASSVVTDDSGNVIVTGWFRDNLTFGTTTLTNAGGSDTYDIFIVKYNPNGDVLWAKKQTSGGTGNEFARCIAVDANGNVIVTGSFASTSITFGTTTLTRQGTGTDIFLVKYDPSGNTLWAKKQTADGASSDNASSVATDTDGNVIITGSFGPGNITFGTTTLTNGSNIFSDAFIVKFNENGNVLWAGQPSGNSSGESVTTDISGNVFLTGTFMTPSIAFGSISLSNPNWPLPDIFIVKCNANGNPIWAKKQTSGGVSNESANSIATDANGNVIVTGTFQSNSITFGNTTLTNAGSDNDIFIVKYDPNGNVLWAKQQETGGSLDDVAKSIAADANGNLLVSGTFKSSTITFGTTTLTNAGIGSTDIFIVKYDPNGNVLWAKQQDAGGSLADAANGVAAQNNGSVYVAGNFSSPSINFGATTLTNEGSSNMFIVKLETVTGIANTTFYNELNVFPNPASNQFTITLGSNNKNVEVNMFDITGKLIYTHYLADKLQLEVNTADFNDGIYLVQIQSEGFVETRKLIIAR